MKKPYQIGAGRAVQRVRQWAEEKNPTVQLMLPMIEILALAKQGAGELVREAGLRVILLAIQQEADAMTGARHEHGPDRQALRWSREDGFVVVDGQKVPIERRRLRSKNGGEVRLGTYELFQQTRTLEDEVWWKMLRGLTTRNYPLVTRSFAQAYGIEKSATSERFIEIRLSFWASLSSFLSTLTSDRFAELRAAELDRQRTSHRYRLAVQTETHNGSRWCVRHQGGAQAGLGRERMRYRGQEVA